MKNSEIAITLKGLAKLYAATPDAEPLTEPDMFVHVYSKEMAVRLVKGVGGMFKKRLLYSGDDTLIYESQRLPGFSIWIPRDKVCVKIPERYECQPLLSPEEEAVIFTGVDVE